MKLADAFALYERHAIEMAKSTAKTMKSQLRTFERLSGASRTRDITADTFVAFKRASITKGLSPATANSVCRAVSTVLRHLGPVQHGIPHGQGLIDSVPYCGKKLKERRSPKWQPSLKQLGKLYEHTSVARWPVGPVRPATFWRCWLVTAYNTALRRDDIFFRLTWESVDFDARTITVTAAKTSKTHCVPINDVLERHLKWMWSEKDRVFPIGQCRKQVSRELARISEAAGVPKIGPQSIRRLACTQLEIAQPGAGSLLLGHSLQQTVTYQSYAQQVSVLRPAMERLEQPGEFSRKDLSAQLYLF